MDVLRGSHPPVPQHSFWPVSMRARLGGLFMCMPLPRWASVSLVVVAVTALVSDVAGDHLMPPFTAGSLPVLGGLLLCYSALAVMGFFPLLGAGISWLALGFSLWTSDFGLPLLVASATCMVVAARCSRVGFVLHTVVCLAWGVLASQRQVPLADELRVLWTVELTVVLSIAVGLGLRVAIERQVRQAATVNELERVNAKIRQEERSALARELHDVVAHELTVITMQVMGRRASRDPDELQQVLSIVDDSARSALQELRKMLVVLRDDGLLATTVEQSGDDPSLRTILQSLADELIGLGYPATWSYRDGGSEKLTPTLLRTCSRILLEAVTNILKHARRGSPCRLEGEVGDGWIHLRVENRLSAGAVRNVAGSSSLGLLGLGERVDLLHGTIRAGSRGDEWVVEVSIPLNP